MSLGDLMQESVPLTRCADHGIWFGGSGGGCPYCPGGAGPGLRTVDYRGIQSRPAGLSGSLEPVMRLRELVKSEPEFDEVAPTAEVAARVIERLREENARLRRGR